MASLENTDLTSNLLPALSSYPELASAAAWQAAQIQNRPPTNIEVTFYDAFYNQIGQCTDYISLEAEFKRNDMGQATIVLKSSDPLCPLIMQCVTTTVPVTIQLGANMRWSGRVNSYAYSLDDKNTTLTVQCVDDFTWFSRIMVWPNYLLPIQVQVPTNAIFVGPIISCALTMVAEQAWRLQSGANEFFNNAVSFDLDWEAWIGTFLESNGNTTEMLMCPIVVQNIDPLFDTSPWVALTGRMDKIYDLLKDSLMMYGCSLTAELWLPGDPQPSGDWLVGQIPLETDLVQPCILVSCVDRQGVTGPTGTFIDGLIEDTIDLTDSIFGTTLAPFLNPNNEYYPANLGINIAPALGVNFVPSWVVFNGDESIGDNPLLNYKLTGYHPIAYQVIGGGKSPQWLDDLINATLEFWIDALEITVGFTGIPDSLFDGTFDDLLLAFQLQENYPRRQQLGPYAFPEYFTKTGASAYTLDEWFALMQAMYDTQGYNCIQLTWENGFPYTVGMDVFLGALVSFVLNGQLYTDYVYSIKLTDNRTTRAQVEVIVGDGKREVNPILRVVKMLTGLEEVINVLSFSGN
jgi:hypothetical protein